MLVDRLSWRWLFVVPLVLPLAALAITRTLPETPARLIGAPTFAELAALLALCGISVALILGPADAARALW